MHRSSFSKEILKYKKKISLNCSISKFLYHDYIHIYHEAFTFFLLLLSYIYNFVLVVLAKKKSIHSIFFLFKNHIAHSTSMLYISHKYITTTMITHQKIKEFISINFIQNFQTHVFLVLPLGLHFLLYSSLFFLSVLFLLSFPC